MGAKVNFNTSTKTIEVTQAPQLINGEMVVELDVKIDIYSDGKEDWRSTESLRRFLYPVSAVGGNPLPGSKALGATFFLDSSWKVQPYAADHIFRVNGNFYSEDGTSPFKAPAGGYSIFLEQQVSSLVDSTVQQLDEIQYSLYNQGVCVDILNNTGRAISGTGGLIGTYRTPSNNMTDALIIANREGLDKIYILGNHLTLQTGDVVDNMTLIGTSHANTELIIETGASCVNVNIEECKISGILDGGTSANNCLVGDITYVNGHIHNSGLYGTIVLDGNKDAVIQGCHTVDQASAPIIDMNFTGQSLAMSGYSGIATIKNLSDATKTVGIGLDHGLIILDSSITAGTIIIAGIGLITDNSGGTAVVDVDALVNRDLIADAVWDSIVDSGFTAQEILRLIASASAAKLSGAETTTINIRDLADTKNRIVATVDSNGNRTAVVHNVSE